LNGADAADDAAKPGKGEALFIECGTQPALGDFGEIVRGQVTTAGNGALTFKAISIFQDDDGPTFGTCKWNYKRTDATPPSVTPCP
jgi:hypothetical protein